MSFPQLVETNREYRNKENSKHSFNAMPRHSWVFMKQRDFKEFNFPIVVTMNDVICIYNSLDSNDMCG